VFVSPNLEFDGNINRHLWNATIRFQKYNPINLFHRKIDLLMITYTYCEL